MRLRKLDEGNGVKSLIKLTERQLRTMCGSALTEYSDVSFANAASYTKDDDLTSAARAFSRRTKRSIYIRGDKICKLSPLEYFRVSQGFLSMHKVYDKLIDRFIDIKQRKNEAKGRNS